MLAALLMPDTSYVQAALRPSAARPSDIRLEELEAVVASITDGLVIADAEGHLLAMNPAALRMHQYETVEEAQRHFTEYADCFELHTPDGAFLPVEEWPMARALRGERFEGHEVEVYRRDTDHRWVGSYSGTPVRDGDGTITRAVLTIRDITEQKQAEQAAREATEALTRRVAELDAIIESIPDAVYIGTAEGIEWANQDALDQLGYSSVDELDRHIGELAEQIQTRHLDTGERVAPGDEAFAHALRGERFVREVLVRHLRNGEDRVIRSAASPIRVGGAVVAAVAVNTDVTERVRAVEALQEAKERAEAALRSRDEVLAVVSHDLRGLLSTVMLGASSLREGPGAHRRPAALIASAAERMRELIEDLLDVARMEAGRPLPVEREPMDLRALLREAADTYQPQMEAKGVRFDRALPEDALPVHADAKRIFQVIANLLGNALKFTPEGGRVRLQVERRGEEVAVTIDDTGPGIRTEDQARIFQPYWQADQAKRHGAGLGLPIAQSLVERHGGTLQVRSVPGEGSAFSFTLPLGTD